LLRSLSDNNSQDRKPTTFVACIMAAVFAQVGFKPARVNSVTDAYLPYQVVYDGFVVLEVFLDGHGAVVETRALRDPGAMVPAAVASVGAWKFHPAEVGGRALPSAMTAVFGPAVGTQWTRSSPPA
jgi:hypothetical protein